MNLVPLAHRVLIKPAEPVTESQGGLALVQDWTQETTGDVVALGHDSDALLAVGQHVLFSWLDGQEVTIGDERYLLLRDDQILAVLED